MHQRKRNERKEFNSIPGAERITDHLSADKLT